MAMDFSGKFDQIIDLAEQIKQSASTLNIDVAHGMTEVAGSTGGHDFTIVGLTVLMLAVFVGYHVVWRVTPALHSPLMSVTNAISSVIIVGALIAVAAAGNPAASIFGFLGVMLASVNIFGGFIVTRRMLTMFKKKI